MKENVFERRFNELQEIDREKASEWEDTKAILMLYDTDMIDFDVLEGYTECYMILRGEFNVHFSGLVDKTEVETSKEKVEELMKTEDKYSCHIWYLNLETLEFYQVFGEESYEEVDD